MKKIITNPLMEMISLKSREARLALEYQIAKWDEMSEEERIEIVNYIRLLRREIKDLLGKINRYDSPGRYNKP